MAKVQSVEPNIADLANGWLKSYKLPYKLEQESLSNDGKNRRDLQLTNPSFPEYVKVGYTGNIDKWL